MRPRREHVGHDLNRTVTVAFRPGPEFGFEWHYHPVVEIVLITRGHGTRLVGDSLGEFGPGDLVLVGEDLPHTWATAPVSDTTAEAIWIHLDRHRLAGLPEIDELDALFEYGRRGLQYPAQLPRVREQLFAALHKGRLDQLACVLGVAAALAEHADMAVPLASSDYVRHLPTKHRDGTSERIVTVLNYVDSRYAHDIDHRTVCELAAMTPAAFSRFFKRTTGRTFTRYVQEVRIGQACLHLIDADEPVTSIAFAVGFNNISHFNRTFRSVKGFTPSQWRQRINALAAAGANGR